MYLVSGEKGNWWGEDDHIIKFWNSLMLEEFVRDGTVVNIILWRLNPLIILKKLFGIQISKNYDVMDSDLFMEKGVTP